MIILGIDPGTATTGYGIIQSQKLKVKSQKFLSLSETKPFLLKYLGCGCISTKPTLSSPDRLRQIHNEVSKLILRYKPSALAIENVYFFKNWKTAIPVSQAKGVIMLAAAKKKVPVFEYTPLQIKSAITGYGTADKQQVQRMLKVLLNLKEPPKPDDAADALGVAICHMRLVENAS